MEIRTDLYVVHEKRGPERCGTLLSPAFSCEQLRDGEGPPSKLVVRGDDFSRSGAVLNADAWSSPCHHVFTLTCASNDRELFKFLKYLKGRGKAAVVRGGSWGGDSRERIFITPPTDEPSCGSRVQIVYWSDKERAEADYNNRRKRNRPPSTSLSPPGDHPVKQKMRRAETDGPNDGSGGGLLNMLRAASPELAVRGATARSSSLGPPPGLPPSTRGPSRIGGGEGRGGGGGFRPTPRGGSASHYEPHGNSSMQYGSQSGGSYNGSQSGGSNYSGAQSGGNHYGGPQSGGSHHGGSHPSGSQSSGRGHGGSHYGPPDQQTQRRPPSFASSSSTPAAITPAYAQRSSTSATPGYGHYGPQGTGRPNPSNNSRPAPNPSGGGWQPPPLPPINRPTNEALADVVPNGGSGLVAIDCEMVGIGRQIDGDGESMLARVSITDFDGECIYDHFVQAQEDVTDYRTEYSGVRPEDIDPASGAKAFVQVQQEVRELLEGKVLVGHELKSDLSSLKMDHAAVRDTAHYTPLMKYNTRWRSYRSRRLRDLSVDVLGLRIQGGEHSSVEDARAAMLLYRAMARKWEAAIVSGEIDRPQQSSRSGSGERTAYYQQQQAGACNVGADRTHNQRRWREREEANDDEERLAREQAAREGLDGGYANYHRDVDSQAWGQTNLSIAIPQNKKMQQCRSLQQINETLDRERHRCNYVNVVTSVMSVTKNMDSWLIEKAQLDWLLMITEAVVYQLRARELANLVWALGKLGTAHVSNDNRLLKLAVFHAEKKLTQMKPQELANTAWALATLEFPTARNFLDRLSQSALPKVGMMKLQEVSNLAWALATLCHRPSPHLMNEIANNCLRQVDRMNNQDVANTCWAFAALDFTTEFGELYEAMGRRGMEVVHTMSPQNMSNTVWAYARLNVPENLYAPLLLAIADAAIPKLDHVGHGRAHDFAIQAMSNIVWGLAARGLRHDGIAVGVAREIYRRCTTPGLPGLINGARALWLQQTVNYVWACASMWSVGGHGYGMSKIDSSMADDPCMTRMWDEVVFPSMLNEGRSSLYRETQNASNLLWAVAKFHRRNADFMEMIVEQFPKSSGRCSAQDLSNTAWAFATLRYDLDPQNNRAHGEFVESLAAAAAAKSIANLFDAQNVANTLWAFCRMGVNKSQGHWDHVQALVENAKRKMANVSVSSSNMLQREQFKALEMGLMLYGIGFLGYHDEAFLEASALHIGRLANKADELAQLPALHVINCIWCFAQFDFRNEDALGALMQALLSVMENLDIFDAGIFVWSFASLGLRPDDASVQRIFDHIRRNEDEIVAGQTVANCLWSLAVWGETLPAEVRIEIANRLSSKANQILAKTGGMDQDPLAGDDGGMWRGCAARQSQGGKKTEKFHHKSLASCHQAISLFSLQFGTEVEVDPAFGDLMFASWSREKSAIKRSSKFHMDVSAAFHRMGIPHLNEAEEDIDIKIEREEADGGRIVFAVEVDGPHHFVSNGRRWLGRTVLKHNILVAHGFIVVHIPYWEWNDVKASGEARTSEYLHGKLANAAANNSMVNCDVLQ